MWSSRSRCPHFFWSFGKNHRAPHVYHTVVLNCCGARVVSWSVVVLRRLLLMLIIIIGVFCHISVPLHIAHSQVVIIPAWFRSCRPRLLCRRTAARLVFSLHQCARRLCCVPLPFLGSFRCTRPCRCDEPQPLLTLAIAFSIVTSVQLGHRLLLRFQLIPDGRDHIVFSFQLWFLHLVTCPLFFHCSRDSFCHASRRSGGVSQFLPQMQSFYPIRRTLSYCTIRVFGHFPPHAPLFCHSARRAVSAQRRSARLSACSPINSFTATAFSNCVSCSLFFPAHCFWPSSRWSFFCQLPFFGPILHRTSPTLPLHRFFSSSFFFFTFFHVLRLLLFLPPHRCSARPCTLADATAESVPGFSFCHSSAVSHSSSSALMPLFPPPSTSPPLFSLSSCSAPPFFFPGEGLRRDSGNSACSSSSNSSCSAHSSSIPSTSSLVSTVSNCCASATIAPVSVPSLSADLLYPLPPVPRVQRPWVRPVSHLPGGTRYPLRVEPAFGGRSKKQGSNDRGPDRCFSSSGGGVGSGYWRSHRPQKQRGQLHSRRRHFSHTAALNSSSSSTACSTAPIIVSTSSPSPFQKRRLAYQRFYNETILSFPPVTEPEKTEFVPTFPCYPPAPLNDPSTVPRPLRVPMPTLCRLDFGLPLPPPPPLGRPFFEPPSFFAATTTCTTTSTLSTWTTPICGWGWWCSILVIPSWSQSASPRRKRQYFISCLCTFSCVVITISISLPQFSFFHSSYLGSQPFRLVSGSFWLGSDSLCFVGCHSCFWVSFPWGALRKDFFLFFFVFFGGGVMKGFFLFFFLGPFLGLFSRDFFCFFFVAFLFCVVAGVHVPFFLLLFSVPAVSGYSCSFFFGGDFSYFLPLGRGVLLFFFFFSSGAFFCLFFFYFFCFFSYFLPSGRGIVLFFFLFLLLVLFFVCFSFIFGFFSYFLPSGRSVLLFFFLFFFSFGAFFLFLFFFSVFFLLFALAARRRAILFSLFSSGAFFCLFFFYFWVFLVVFSSPTGLSPCLCAGPECSGSHLVFTSRYFFCFFFGALSKDFFCFFLWSFSFGGALRKDFLLFFFWPFFWGVKYGFLLFFFYLFFWGALSKDFFCFFFLTFFWGALRKDFLLFFFLVFFFRGVLIRDFFCFFWPFFLGALSKDFFCFFFLGFWILCCCWGARSSFLLLLSVPGVSGYSFSFFFVDFFTFCSRGGASCCSFFSFFSSGAFFLCVFLLFFWVFGYFFALGAGRRAVLFSLFFLWVFFFVCFFYCLGFFGRFFFSHRFVPAPPLRARAFWVPPCLLK